MSLDVRERFPNTFCSDAELREPRERYKDLLDLRAVQHASDKSNRFKQR
jgi:hypothetical protein